MPEVPCDFCGKLVHRTPRNVQMNKRNFCCVEHKVAYRKEHNEWFYNEKKTFTYLRLKEMAKNRAELKKV